MSLENYYLKLPDFIKFNPKILKLSFDFADRFNERTGISPQDYISQLASRDSQSIEIHRKFRVMYVELLIFIDKVCNKHDIDYWLGFGTLLGAVRHGGFIPWDDDIDLVLLRKDYQKLIEVLPEEIVKYGLDKDCGLTLLLENRKNYFKDFKSVYEVKDNHGNDLIDGKYNFLQFAWLKPFVKIDLFPFDFIAADALDDIYDKFAPAQYRFNQDLLKNKVKFFDEIDSRRSEVGFTDEVTKQFSDTIEGVPHWKIRIFDYDKTFPLTSVMFEDHEFKCPKDVNHHLTSMFRPNYMEYPKIIENHNTLELIEKQFSSEDEMEKSFDDVIDFLRKINETFE
jgi:lipopolysaccharide cholinephosphotransferase